MDMQIINIADYRNRTLSDSNTQNDSCQIIDLTNLWEVSNRESSLQQQSVNSKTKQCEKIAVKCKSEQPDLSV